MKLTKKLFLLILALLIASACFIGCSGDDNHNDGDDDKNSTSAEIKDDDQNGKGDNTNSILDIILPHEHTYSNGVCTVCGKAEPKPSEGLEYTLNYDGESYSVSGRGSCQDAHIVIPATHDGKPVTTIGKEAFTTNSRGEYHGDKLLTEVTIPDSVTRIEERAFYKCTSLVSITIPNSVTDIGVGVFGDCTSLKYNEYNNGKYLGNSSNPYVVLYEVINRNVSSFGIHENAKTIGSHAVSHCTSLTSIAIPDSVTSIGDHAFWASKSLKSITIPDSVTSIDTSAFSDCSSLTSVTIPDSVTSIGERAFSGCTSLTSINYGGTIEQWNAVDKYVNLGGVLDFSWNARTGDYTIHCTDGDVSK